MFHWIHQIQWQNIFFITAKWLEPATSFVRDQDASTVPARHMSEVESLNWAQFMLPWFIRFPEFAEFTEFSECSAPFRKKLQISNGSYYCTSCNLLRDERGHIVLPFSRGMFIQRELRTGYHLWPKLQCRTESLLSRGHLHNSMVNDLHLASVAAMTLGLAALWILMSVMSILHLDISNHQFGCDQSHIPELHSLNLFTSNKSVWPLFWDTIYSLRPQRNNGRRTWLDV